MFVSESVGILVILSLRVCLQKAGIDRLCALVYGAIFYASRLTEVMWRSVRQQDRAKTTLQNFMQLEAEVEQSLPCRQNAHALLLGENSRR